MSCMACRSTGLRPAASAGRRASAQHVVQPQSTPAAISPAMQLPSSVVPTPVTCASGQDSAANYANNQAEALSERQTAIPVSSMSVQPVAFTSRLVLSDVSTSAELQAAASHEDVSCELSDKASRQGVAGSLLPQGTCPPDGQCCPLCLQDCTFRSQWRCKAIAMCLAGPSIGTVCHSLCSLSGSGELSNQCCKGILLLAMHLRQLRTY